MFHSTIKEWISELEHIQKMVGFSNITCATLAVMCMSYTVHSLSNSQASTEENAPLSGNVTSPWNLVKSMKTSALYLLFSLHYTNQWCLQRRTYFNVLSVATHLHIYVRVYHVRNSRQEPKGKNWSKEHEEKCLLDCSSMISSACLLIQSEPPAFWWYHPQWSGPMYQSRNNQQSRKCPTDIPMRRFDVSSSSTGVPCSQVTLFCVKLTEIDQHIWFLVNSIHEHISIKLQSFLSCFPNLIVIFMSQYDELYSV